MFRGQFVHTVDKKGRVSMPARFRELLAADGPPRIILTPAPFDPCLHLHPLRAWEEFESGIDQLPRLDPHITRFRRIYVSAAVECELDRTGRVLVPPHFRERAELHRDVLWAGMGRTVELWSTANWEAALTIGPDEEADFREAVRELIRI
jgi:MraZ protein